MDADTIKKFATPSEVDRNRQETLAGRKEIAQGFNYSAHVEDYRIIEARRDENALLVYGTQSGKVERAKGSAIRI